MQILQRVLNRDYNNNISYIFEDIRRSIHNCNYNLNDIKELISLIADPQQFNIGTIKDMKSNKIGLFLTCLTQFLRITINEKKHFDISNLSPLNYIGYQLDGRLLSIKGSLGDYVGSYMISGGLEINGNVGKNVGLSMSNGTILIYGNAGEDVGNDMKGGIIYAEEITNLSEDFSGGLIIQNKKIIKGKEYLTQKVPFNSISLQLMRRTDDIFKWAEEIFYIPGHTEIVSRKMISFYKTQIQDVNK